MPAVDGSHGRFDIATLIELGDVAMFIQSKFRSLAPALALALADPVAGHFEDIFEWQFSVGSIIALFHDVTITLGIFSLLSLEINLSIIAAVLTIVGYSMNDTVVIYDRIRENLLKYNKISISDISNLSINETLARTIITSVTTLLALFSIYILGGEILRGFSFAMILGVIIGTYSSIFVASPILKFFKVSYKTLEKEDEKIVP